MPNVAYLANQFPSTVEPYVRAEIDGLRRCGIAVIAGSVRRTVSKDRRPQPALRQFICLQPIRILTVLRALGLMVSGWHLIKDLVWRALWRGQESPRLRLKALLHTWLGAYYAVLLGKRRVEHIHVHHGYFGSWIAMVASRLLGISYSLTLHGSDLLMNGNYLDEKLKNCRFCVTISEYNRDYIFSHFPQIDRFKIVVARLGVNIPEHAAVQRRTDLEDTKFSVLAVGRLHPVKDHAFLVRACGLLRDADIEFNCSIAGDGQERGRLETLIREGHLQSHVKLLGHVDPAQIESIYRRADVIVLTSRSEGLPLVLMEAMAGGGIVLAPKITGIPELVIPGKTGFLYSAGDLEDFVARLIFIHELICGKRRYATSTLDWIRLGARLQILHNFSGRKNLDHFCQRFLQRIGPHDFEARDRSSHEDFVLQQI